MLQLKKLSSRNLTSEEKVKIAELLFADNGGVVPVTINEIIQELDNSIMLAFDTPSKNVFVVRVCFIPNEDMTFDKIVEEYLISKYGASFAGDIDII